jgi:hypothetical protein
MRDALLARNEEVEDALRGHDQAFANHAVAQKQMVDKVTAERNDLVRGETQRRAQELSVEEAALKAEHDRLAASWQALATALVPAKLRPAGYSVAEIDAARERWQHQRRRDDEGCRFACQWADYLDHSGDELLPRLPALANLLAGPIAAISGGGAGTADGPIDLLIVEDAERLTEAELFRMAAHAPRLLLVSQAMAEPPSTAAPASKGPRAPGGLAPATACWPRLWQALGDDLGRIPYAWHREGDRLICDLTVVRADEARHLEREGLADAPEIELHILNLPRARPVLARVTFPSHYTIPQATAFIHSELQELAIQPLGRTAWWEASADTWILHMGPTAAVSTDRVDLGGGVSMQLVGGAHDYAGRASRLEFDRAAGWDRSAAERWLQTQLHWRGRERSIFLQVPYRMDRPLADVVGPLLFPEACLARLLGPHAASEARFEFIPVPMPRKPDWPREGAGLELDLAAGRHPDRIPADLRGELPRQGIVNYLEAQALVRRLEEWARAPAARRGNGKAAPSVLVVALYAAQAELLRRLVARSALLRSCPFPLEVAAPGQARQRECDILVLSLTRSHAHRCVPLGEDAADLALALTRPRQRLVVFGDIGTLAKRTQWHGPLDHLDAAQAHLEGQRVGRLLRHVQSQPRT